MTIHLPLAQMTLEEKLEVMEALWADLAKQHPEAVSPPWHREMLQERKRLVEEGKLKFENWETAYADLRNELRGNKNT